MMQHRKPIIISLGGSLIYSDRIDVEYIKKFRKIILNHLRKTHEKIIIVTGGGKICRDYNRATQALWKSVPDEELDWMGIKCTKVNAELVRLAFNGYSYFKVIDHPQKNYLRRKKDVFVFLSGGVKPGQSSDAVAVSLAKAHGADTIVNLSNIPYAYDKDPKKYRSAKRLKNIPWSQFCAIVGDEYKPGGNWPFDPAASKRAKRYKMKVIIADGKDLKNFRNILEGKKYKGTTIQ